MELQNFQVLALLEEQFEDLELWYPAYRMAEAGANVQFAAPEARMVYKGKYGVPATSHLTLAEVNPEHFDALLIPGGWAPDKLRRLETVLNIVRHFDSEKKPIGQICHAGWVLISAGILKGRHVTSTIAIKDDLENAGAIWSSQQVVVDRNLVSAQRPPDLPDYLRAFFSVCLQYQKDRE